MLNRRHSSLLILAVVFMCVLLPSSAMAKTWVGASGDWNVDTNWSPIGVPTSTDDVDIPASINNIVTVLNSSVTASSIIVGSGATLNIRGFGSPTSVTASSGVANNGTIQFYADSVGTATLDSGSSMIVNYAGATITDTGSFVTGHYLHGDVDNQGVISITKGMTFNKASGVHTSSGLITIGGVSSLTVQNGSLTNTGIIQGSGTLDVAAATFMNNGTVSPNGDAGPIGKLTIAGDFPMMSSSVLMSEISGTATAGTDYDQLAVSGYVTLGGSLSVVLNGYVPSLGDLFTVISAPTGTLSGTFSMLSLPDLGAGKGWNVVYNTTSVVLSVVDTPNITITPNYAYYDYVHVGIASSATFTVSNTGSADLIISSATITSADFIVSGNTCTTVAPGGSCIIDVTFKPLPLGIGDRYSTLTIASNDPDTPSLITGLSGIGVYNLVSNNTNTSGGLISDCPPGIVCEVSKINCGTTCSNLVPDGSTIMLYETANADYVFSGWSSSQVTCPGGGPCVITMNQDVSLSGGFCSGSFGISPASATFSSFFVSSGSLAVTQLTGSCNWTANGDSPMIKVTAGANSSGNGTVNYSVNASPDLLGTLSAAGQTFVVTRSGVAGGFDTTFGSPNGFVTSPTITAGDQTYIKAAALQSDGKIVAAGYHTDSTLGTDYVFVSRFTSTGALDDTFGTGGIVSYATTTPSYASGLAIRQSDGSIVITGHVYNAASGDDVLVSRLTSTGLLDTSFNVTGVKTWNGPSNSGEQGHAVAIDPVTGKIVVAGTMWNGTDNDALVVRFNTDGSLDTTLATNGFITISNPVPYGDDSGNAVAIQTGNILVTGYLTDASYNPHAFVARYIADGTADVSFGTGGMVTLANPRSGANAIAVQPDGKILAAGNLFNGTDYDSMLLRYNADGTPDTTFNASGTPGMSLYDTGRDNSADAMALQPDGKIVLVGSTSGFSSMKNDALIVQYNADGTLDSNFGKMGAVTFNGIGNDNDSAAAVLVQPDTKIIVAGQTYDPVNSLYKGVVMRLQTFTPIDKAVDNTSLVWTTGGDASWFGQYTMFSFGGSAAQSGHITDLQSTWVETTVTGPAYLVFMWKVSSEYGNDYLNFSIDGAAQPGGISGEVDWQPAAYTIPSGPHTLRWTYAKNGSASYGSDAGWLDHVVVVPFVANTVSITNTAPARKSIATNATVSYTLSEKAQAGKVIFTRTGGTADPGSPHAYTLTGAELDAGTHTVNPGFPLVDEAFYTVSFEAVDLAGNPAATVSNALVFYDSGYGKRPAGKVANDGSNIVNDNDVNKMKSYMNTRPGDPDWNPACDLDKNNVIDQRDLMILMQHYGL